MQIKINTVYSRQRFNMLICHLGISSGLQWVKFWPMSQENWKIGRRIGDNYVREYLALFQNNSIIVILCTEKKKGFLLKSEQGGPRMAQEKTKKLHYGWTNYKLRMVLFSLIGDCIFSVVPSPYYILSADLRRENTVLQALTTDLHSFLQSWVKFEPLKLPFKQQLAEPSFSNFSIDCPDLSCRTRSKDLTCLIGQRT